MPARPSANRADNRPSRPGGGSSSPILTEPPGPPPIPLGETAADYWAALWTAGTCAASDAYAVALLADLLARREHLRAVIEEEGWTLTTRNGPTMHPAARLLKSAETEAARLLSKLGLDPEARTRLAVKAPPARFDAAAFVAAFTEGSADG